MMANSLVIVFGAILSVTVLTRVEAQTGIQCFNCYSRVCGANPSELESLIQNELDCCECFTGNLNCNISTAADNLNQMFGSRPLNECCSNVSRIVRTESYEQSTQGVEGACENGGDLCFHSQQELSADTDPTPISAGVYIVPHFQFDRSGCISSLSIRLFSGTEVSGLRFTVYSSYTSRDSAIRSELYEQKFSFPVSLRETEPESLNILTVTPSPMEPRFCVEAGDTLGFSVLETARFKLARAIATTDVSVQNITGNVREQSCEELNGLVESLPFVSDGLLERYDPLIAVDFGPLSTITPTTSAPSPEATTSATSTLTPTPVLTQAPGTPGSTPPVLPMIAIYVIGAGGGAAILLLLLICTIVTCLCCRRRRRETFVVDKRNRVDTLDIRLDNSRTSQRLQELSPQKITVENLAADEYNHYDVPTEHMQFFHQVGGRGIPRSHSCDSYKYMTMNSPVEGVNGVQVGRLASTGQQLAFGAQEDAGVYSDPTELETNPPSHYDVPTALMRGQAMDQVPPPFYHELEGPIESNAQTDSGDNIYTETAFGLAGETQSRDSVFESDRSVRSSSIETNLTGNTSMSCTRESMASDTPLISHPHFYHELENSGTPKSRRARSRSPLSPLVHTVNSAGGRADGTADSLERSTGGHRTFEPGIYVPGGEERQQLAVVKADSEEYKSWRQKSHKASKQKKQFFEETLTFWEPENKEDGIYNQLKDRKFREILREHIVFSSHLGVGQFGSVSKATWYNQQGGSGKKVAIKTLKPTIKMDTKVAFLKEAAIMGQFSHSNVVQLYGVVTVGEPIMIVMELMALGDLDTYLYNNYRPGEMPPPHKKTLLSFSRQVACGMKYLARKNFVHRDLAARNVLVTETLVCKIGDFGMSRILSDSNYYASKGGTVPIKWTAPEGLNYKKFSSASDVYSYGMVLYEIWSLGLKPLAHIKIQNVSQFVTEGRCQPPPPGCPRRIYEIMVHCWSPEQHDRPTFSEIFEILNGSDIELLSWFDEDMAQISNFAMTLGAPLSEARNMFPDLQNRNLIREEAVENTEILSTAV